MLDAAVKIPLLEGKPYFFPHYDVPRICSHLSGASDYVTGCFLDINGASFLRI